ncbi:MAG: low molecular weight protein arginine phosphatase [bacterium]|nr:low molecular weight protein arginine phosphatase [bacterium]
MQLILLVCTGNICRSPIAEGLLKQMLENKNICNVTVQSVGIGAGNGFPASANAVTAMQELGINIASHRSQQITQSLIADSDLILVMEVYHREYILSYVPEAEEKVRLVKEFGIHTNSSMDIQDPIGGSIDAYRYCAEEIRTCLLNFVVEYFDGSK